MPSMVQMTNSLMKVSLLLLLLLLFCVLVLLVLIIQLDQIYNSRNWTSQT